MKHLEPGFEIHTPGDSDYSRLINSSGEWEVIIEESDTDYQGDILMLMKSKVKQGIYGYLTFGYGSCSGCDSYLACENDLGALENLRDEMISQIHSDYRKELVHWLLEEHDWEGSFLHKDLVKRFLDRVKEWGGYENEY